MFAPLDHITWMRRAIVEADLARGRTGDNPWVGCVVVDEAGVLLGQGHTQGPGEDHAEMAAFRQADQRGLSLAGATLYSTLEPCSFHGRTPACSRVIVDRKIRRVITGMRDPNPPRLPSPRARHPPARGLGLDAPVTLALPRATVPLEEK